MRFTLISLLPAFSLALPSLASDAQPEIQERQVPGLVGIVTGLLGSVASSVDPANKRPEPGYTFQAPGPNDSRGPCPALNLLANYGYLPRNGHVTFGQILDATARGFNMGTDLATVLAVFATLTDGDIATESWYLGAGPGNVGGLNRHSTVEADISPNKEDYYNGCGNNHAISSRIFTQNVLYAAADPKKQFTYDVMAKHYASNSKFTQKYNPYIYYFPFPSIVSVVAFNFYPEYFSNGTYESGGVANYESISSIIGAEFNQTTGHFKYVPEKWPANWYRRSTPYGAIKALTDGFTRIYPSNPVPMAFGQLGTSNLNATTALCDVYMGINSITPLELAGQTQSAAAAISWALGKLKGVGLDNTTLGCPPNTLSPNFLYPNSSSEGGPLDPPPSVAANIGNNVYNKTYFCTAPTTPVCANTC